MAGEKKIKSSARELETSICFEDNWCNPGTYAIVRFQFTLVQSVFIVAHFLFWDDSQTLPNEKFTREALLAYLGNTDFAAFNQFVIWGTVSEINSTDA